MAVEPFGARHFHRYDKVLRTWQGMGEPGTWRIFAIPLAKRR
jgi:hypothetical protein